VLKHILVSRCSWVHSPGDRTPCMQTSHVGWYCIECPTRAVCGVWCRELAVQLCHEDEP
jgi:hypothetical protein